MAEDPMSCYELNESSIQHANLLNASSELGVNALATENLSSAFMSPPMHQAHELLSHPPAHHTIQT
jgi:hypothetical protein